MIAGFRTTAVAATLTAILGAMLGMPAAPLRAQGAQRAQRAEGAAPAYAPTLTFGTGLVTIPVAWVSPSSGDLFITVSARGIKKGSIAPKTLGSRWHFTESIEAHFGGRLSIGASLYDPQNMHVGAFGQFLIIQQPRTGTRWLPSLAVGALNVGATKYEDRFVVGSNRVADVVGGTAPDGTRAAFNGSPTVYAVATREFQFARALAGGSASMSLGYGNGLFKEDGGLGTVNSQSGTVAPGLFMGARVVIPAGEAKSFALMVDNNGFDWNVGAALTVRGVTAGFFVTELEEKKLIPARNQLANFTKIALKLSYNASLPGIIRGTSQRAEAAEADLALRRLEQEVEQRRIITRRLVADLAKATQAADAAAVAERAKLVKLLEVERAALKAAADRLDALTRKPPEPQR